MMVVLNGQLVDHNDDGDADAYGDDERQWLSAGYAWHSRPRTTTLSSNLRNAGAMSQDERRLFPVRRDLEHLTSKLPRE